MDLSALSEDLATKMAKQLRVGSGDLEAVAAKAGRKLPKHLRAEVALIVEAMRLAEHPKFMHRVDMARLAKAEKKISRFLDKQDPTTERRNEILDTVAKIAFVIFSVVLAVFLTLLWRGYFAPS
jgi:endo-1,4-beta-D-glucanase Y